MDASNQVAGEFGAAVGGDPVYLAQGRRIKVVASGSDDELKVVHVSKMLGGSIDSLVRMDDLLIAGWRSAEGVGQLSWFSLADPKKPEWLYDFAYKGKASANPVDLAVVGNTLYVMDWSKEQGFRSARLYPVDVSDPTAPEVYESLALEGQHPALAVFNERYLLATGDNTGVFDLYVQVIDLEQPRFPEEVAAYQGGLIGGETGVLAGDDFMVLLGTNDTEIVSLIDPVQPELLSTIPSWTHNGLIVDDHLVRPVDGPLELWDLSNPSQPLELASVNLGADYPEQITLGPETDHTTLFYPDGTAFAVDLTSFSDPEPTGELTMPAAHSVREVSATLGGSAAIDSSGSLRLYTPSLDHIELDSDLASNRHYAVATQPDGLGVLVGEFVAVVDFNDSGQPQQLAKLSSQDLPDFMTEAAIVGNQAWAIGRSEIAQLDLSDPSNPYIVSVSEVDEIDKPTGAVVAADHLYISAFNNGLFVFDVQGSSPQLVGEYSDCHGIQALDVEDGLAVLSCGQDSTWKLLDASSPENPVLLSSFAGPTLVAGEEVGLGAQGVLLKGEELWLGLNDYVDLVDVSDPAAPFLITRFHVPGGSRNLAAAPSGAWVAASSGGVARLDAPADLTPGQTAAWYDPERSGEGWIVEMLDDDQALGYWFTYDADGNQRWLIGTGEVRNSRIVFEMENVSGGRFGPDFDPEDVEFTPAGQVRMSWTGCNQGWYQFVPEDDSELSIGFNRLTSALGLEDCAEPEAIESARAHQSGSWYDPAQAGQGFTMQWLDSGKALANWFTFDSEGNPYWMVGTGEAQGEQIVFEDLMATEGARFGEAFDPEDVEQFRWGELVLELDCLVGSAEYESVLSEFGSGAFDLERLTVPAGLNCD